MSAYLKFFELEQSPFDGKAQAQVVLGTRALREALATIRAGLDDDASRICVSGERGLGKTSLARALPKLLGDEARVALVMDPSVSWDSLRAELAQQWGIQGGVLGRRQLIEASSSERLVLVIDQAERADEDFLDHLDVILSYRSELDEPVVQSVLLARLATEPGRSPAPILWWLDRIQTLQLEFAPLPRDGVESYIHRHLKRAGWRGDRLFSPEASRAIHGYTGGIPGEVSNLCEKLLAEAAASRLVAIDADFVHAQCDVTGGDLEEVQHEETETVASTADDEEPWTLEDQFEELLSEEEFDAASEDAAPPPFEAPAPSTPPQPTLAEALEHFGGLAEESASADQPSSEPVDEDDDGTWNFDGLENIDEEADGETPCAATRLPIGAGEIYLTDATALEHDPLYALPTEEELRAIRGGWLSGFTRPLIGAAIAAVVGGLLFSLVLGGSDSTQNDATAGQRNAGSETRSDPDADIRSPEPRLAIERATGSEPVPLFQPGAGFVSADSKGAPNPKQRTRNPGSGTIASTSPHEEPNRVRGTPENAAPSPASPAPSSSPAPRADGDFGWDDLR